LFNINGDVNTRYDGVTGKYNTVSGNNLTTTINASVSHGYGQRIYVGVGNTVTCTVKLLSFGDNEYTGDQKLSDVYFYNDGTTNSRRAVSFKKGEEGVVKTFSFTALTDYIILAFNVYTDYVPSATFTDIQVEIGTVATDYEAYGVQPSPDYPSEIRSVSGDVELKVEGKNKFNNTYNNLALWSVAPNVTTDLAQGNNYLGAYCEVEEGKTYSISKAKITSRFGVAFCKEKPTVNSIVLVYKAQNDAVKMENITIPQGYSYLLLYLSNSSETSEGLNIQIEEGSIATPYEPYKAKTISLPLGDIELRSTPDGTRDTFARVDGVWNKVGNIGSIVIDGSGSGWAQSNDGNMINYYNNSLISFEKRSGYCTHFPVSTDTNFANEITRLCLFSTGKGFGIFAKTSIFGTLTEFLTWLSNNNPQLDYLLATPTYTPITDTALISALDELEQLILHKGYNYITATSVNGVKAQLDLSYIKDINTVLNNLTAMIATIGGELNV
jgi:hypothetical protein